MKILDWHSVDIVLIEGLIFSEQLKSDYDTLLCNIIFCIRKVLVVLK